MHHSLSRLIDYRELKIMLLKKPSLSGFGSGRKFLGLLRVDALPTFCWFDFCGLFGADLSESYGRLNHLRNFGIVEGWLYCDYLF